ncbi:MBL fold metallo-hydrolase [Candidatus Hecatella orcuttiae]|uniref:MBL fold metallo-hydrolase n=1 Tax=Candidatus Hecatella orcuttiae TaxID=1935119 RepID=UPI002867BB6C|nr:MBL fold metallo-hydrolase [Candidatus Hecatella orcuttiae]
MVKVGDSSLCFDPQTSKPSYPHVFISHAHGDHTDGFKSPRPTKYSTHATVSIYETVFGRKVEKIKKLNYGDKFKVDGFEIQLFDSGHILGSAAFSVHTGEGLVVYTGDLNCVDTLVSKAAQLVSCDILIIESTYGRAEFSFPSRDFLYRKMVQWVVEKVNEGRIPVFYVYPIGKAQEVIRLLNRFTEIKVKVHPQIAKVNEAYTRLNVKLEASPWDGVGEKCVAVYPVRRLRNEFDGRNQVAALATGWALKFTSLREGVFPLSSHADFPQLLNYVKEAKPKLVYTCFGSNVELAESIRRKLGIPAQPLPASAGSKSMPSYF